MIRVFQALPTPDEVLSRIQNNITAAFQKLVKVFPIMDGRFVNDVVIRSGSPTVVEHGLDRKPLGYIVVKKNASADVWDSTSDVPERLLYINASGNVVLSLWIF